MKDHSLSEILVAIFVILLASVICVFYGAYALTLAWKWFIVPFGLPVINIAHAYGLSLMIHYFQNHEYTKKTEEKELWKIVAEAVGKMYAKVSVFLLMAWIVSFYM